jgi:hypothetical protein
MEIYYPSLLASAIFFGAFVVNMRNHDYRSALFICIFAIPSIIFLAFLSKKNFDIIGYILILIPIILLYVGYTLGIQQPNPTIPVKTPSTPSTPSTSSAIPSRLESSNYSNICDICKKVNCKCRKKFI